MKTPITDDLLAALEAAAANATAGPWKLSGQWVYTERAMYRARKDGSPVNHPYNGQPMLICRLSGAPKRDRGNAPLLAQCSPDVVLALVDEIRRLRALAASAAPK